jgi:tetratricopeptide (TPR) repeat protein
MKQPKLILEDLQRRYGATNDVREKLSLAFGLASFGQVESEYLVSQIDDIEDGDSANLISALGKDPSRSIDRLNKAAAECTTPELHRGKARLALVALAIGDTNLPVDACEFEGRTDHGIRTHFIDQFPRWELDRAALAATVKDSTSPALRSAVCLGLGQIPVKRISEQDKNLLAELATKWYALPDSSTHSAVAWLMRQWEIPEPTLPDAKQMVDGRNWFVNSQGVTLVRVIPPPIVFRPIPDPVEIVRHRLNGMENESEVVKASVKFRYQRANDLFSIGQFEQALSEADAILKMDLDESMNSIIDDMKHLRLLSLAKLKRAEEAQSALSEWLAGKPDPGYLDYTESLVTLWLGRKEEAIERLNRGLSRTQDSNRDWLYNLACALALFAADGAASDDQKSAWVDQCLKLLEQMGSQQPDSRQQMREDLDLLVLHGNPRFIKLAGDINGVPPSEYWLSSREATRGQFEAFINDVGYQGAKLADWKVSELYNDKGTSPTLQHPVQKVSWTDAVMYCNWLSNKEGRKPAYHISGKVKFKDYRNQLVEKDNWVVDDASDGYRLPAELEWEYSCRAGSSTDWSIGSDEGLLTSYCQRYPSERTALSGDKLPNAWGFHDMHGNVWEWCEDRYDSEGSGRVIRGGCWRTDSAYCRSANRDWGTPDFRADYLGFRVALSSPSGIPQSPEADK